MKAHHIPREWRAEMPSRLKELRRAHGLSQDELAALTGLRQATLSRVERGGDPAPRTVKVLAEFFGVPRPYLMGLDVPKAEEAEPRAREAEEAAV
jgi:transcriptional regulator with XRE-family HTH domain